ncbi:MAG TPA: nucleotidyl transferase AbiEii/AbiGii toxin family protein [Candidatus Saccharimonadales bacterium]|nr:nucleotidyl transferase AbiEii/AbiGii toxin family protein [Candidatus Saccharimonadales bacterium]
MSIIDHNRKIYVSQRVNRHRYINKKNLIELISVTSQHIKLNDAVIEKDYYVTQVIHAIFDVENEYFRLVFSGGTCLAKAYRIVNRMSEDVDFKIQVKKTDVTFSKTRLMKELKKFRLQIKSKLILPGLIISESIVRNQGQYSRIEINYPTAFSASTGLRPHILLEFILSDIRLAIEKISVKTLIEENIENTNLFAPSLIQCVSVEETAIEKWVE